jgi:hypothetical protein
LAGSSSARALANVNRFRTVGAMSTLTKLKASGRKTVFSKSAKVKSPVATWIGSAKGKISIKPGVDLTKPTFKVGKYFD